MGASFVASALEIQKGQCPRWEAARAHIGALDKAKVEAAVLDAYQADSLDDVGLADVEECRQRLLSAVDKLEEEWDERSFDLSYTTVFVAAGMSWGDPPEGGSEISLLCASGAANAAGFMAPEERTPHDMGLVPCKLMVEVHYDKNKTDAESLASAMDILLTTALSTPGIFDEYGPVEVGEFFVLTEE
jgi:hypothetical protein